MSTRNNHERFRYVILTLSLLVSSILLSSPDNALAQTNVTTTGGTINKIPKWSPITTSLTDSAITDLNGNIGIGTTNPGGALDVQQSSSGEVLCRFWNTSPGSGSAALRFVAADASEAKFQFTNTSTWTAGMAGSNNTGNQNNNYLSFRVRGGSDANTEAGLDAATRMTILGNGNVGIGTTSPQAKLHVAGDAQIDGNIAAKYQDMAEWVPAGTSMSAGTVVVLDTGHSNQVVASSRSYDTRVAGVVSAKPAVILGEGGQGKVMVATTGRVRVKVDATSAPIRVGDLLVTSDKEGIAMRSQPLDLGGTPIHRPGTLIGKALEPLEKGVGEILVLLSLQ